MLQGVEAGLPTCTHIYWGKKMIELPKGINRNLYYLQKWTIVAMAIFLMALGLWQST